MLRELFQPANPKENKSLASRKTLQRLCLQGLKQGEHLDLKKRTIQTIIKKQRHYRTSQTLLNQKKLLKDCLCGRNVTLFPQQNFLFSPNEFFIYGSEQYRQMLLREKRIQALHVQSHSKVPLRLLKTIGTLRSLQILELSTLMDQFTTFSRFLKIFCSLQSLKLLVMPRRFGHEEKVIEKDIEAAIYRFSQHLQPIKNLQNLNFQVQPEGFIGTKEMAIALMSMLSGLNIKNFKIALPVSEKTFLDSNKIQSFLEKLEVLGGVDYQLPIEEAPSRKKVLYLVGKQIPDFSKFLEKCSSLQQLVLSIAPVQANIPTTLGSAKGITELQIACPTQEDSTIFPKINQLISEAFNITSVDFKVYHLEQDFCLIHNDLRTTKLKKYRLVLSSMSLFQTSTFTNLCQQIGSIQSLEELVLDCYFIEDWMSFESLFADLPNLKKLSIEVRNVARKDSSFPFKSLSLLPSLEELTIVDIEMKKKEALSRLPKLPNLNNLHIRCSLNRWDDVISMDEYNKKFPS